MSLLTYMRDMEGGQLTTSQPNLQHSLSLDISKTESKQPRSLDCIKTPELVSQGTQVTTVRRTRASGHPILRHHASELLLSPNRMAGTRTPKGQPFFTARSGHPPPLDLYYGYASRMKKRPNTLHYSSESPTNSLDCLALKMETWSTEPMISQAKLNGGPLSLQVTPTTIDERRLGTPASAGSSKSCRCPCRCGGVDSEPMPPPLKGGVGGGHEHVPQDTQCAEGLSWRRLHMSRAKLKATATTSELLSGFAMVAMVELQINDPTNVPEWLFIMFAVCTTVLVAVHIFALMISTYLLPNIDAVSKMSAGDILRESPHERMRGFIELAWAFSTVLGLFLFLVEIAILCWVKFWDYSFAAATAATVIVIPVLIVFVAFAVHFYHSLVVHKCKASIEDMKQLEIMKRNLDSSISAQSPV